jgi:aryl-phospho-beta-D-glucosidase BglC (GH1 family)
MHSQLSFVLTVFFILIFVFLLLRFIWRDPEKRAAFKRQFHKIKTFIMKAKTGEDSQQPIAEPHAKIQPPTAADVAKYRYHHGVNLGSVFILERWLTASMFPENSTGTSELAAVEAWVRQDGIEKARERFEKHWKGYVSDSDLDWLRHAAKCTTLRLPIGYFTLGSAHCEHTPFQAVAPVYKNAWEAVKDLVHRCHERGIGVLIDLHGLPGGANDQDHSGTNSGKAELWGNHTNLELATKAVCFIAEQARCMEGVIGIQIVNEAQTNAKGMYDWYDHVLSEVSRIDPATPIYVSDGWNLTRAVTWVQAKNSMHTTTHCNPVVIDTHLYWAFSDQDKQKTPQQIIYEVHGKLSELDSKEGSVSDRGAAQVVVGEYSCVLPDESWAKADGTPKDQLVRQFGEAQSQRYQHRAGGCMIWTYWMDWMPGGEWGYQQMNEQRDLCIPPSLVLSTAEVRNRVNQAQAQKAQRKNKTVSAHSTYWDTNYPGTYEHWRFEQGWDIGFNDALAFFDMRGQHGHEGGDKIGMLDLWCLKRLRESGQTGNFVWEFEQGLRQGIRDFCESVVI